MNAVGSGIVEDRPACPQQPLVALQPVAEGAQRVGRHVEIVGTAVDAIVALPVAVGVLEPGLEAGARFEMPGVAADHDLEAPARFGGQVLVPRKFADAPDERGRPVEVERRHAGPFRPGGMTLPVDAELPVCLFRMLRRGRHIGFGGGRPDRARLPLARLPGFGDALRRAGVSTGASACASS